MADIFSIGLSGLNSATLAIATSSNNISNSTTPGYVDESPVLGESAGQNSGAGYVGGGVTTQTIQRAYSQYLTSQLNSAQTTNSSLTASYSLASELSNLVGSPTGGIAASIASFFTGLQSVANAPSNTATRQSALADAQTLADELNSAGQQYASMRQSANTQLTNAVTQVNTYSKQIAQLNTQIEAASASGQPPNQLLDERDQDVSNLSQLIGVQVVQNSSGYSLFLGNGQPLVVGAQNYSLTTAASNTNPNDLTVAWSSPAGSTAAPQPLAPAALQGGTIGGIVSYVSQTLDPAQSQLGAIATSFAAQVNGQNALGINLAGQPGGALFSVNPVAVSGYSANTGTATLAVTLTDPTSPPTDNFALSYKNGTYTLTDTTTGNVAGTTNTAPSAANPFVAGGLSITTTGGVMNNGDTYSIQPTAGALASFTVATSDPASIAAASPVLVYAGAPSNGPAAVTSYATNTGNAALSATPTNAATALADTYTLAYDGTTYTLTDTTTGAVAGTTTTTPSAANPFVAGGLSITATSGTMNAGDAYSIQPAGSANNGTATVTQGTVTAGYAVPSTPLTMTYNATTGMLSGFADGTTISYTTPGASAPTTLTIDSTATPPVTGVPYNPNTGATYTIVSDATDGVANVSFTMSGTPANGDTFTIAANKNGTEDGSNALELADLTSSTTFDGANTLTSAYAGYVNAVGNAAQSLQASSTAQQSLVTQLTDNQQSVEGVNLDQEAANLEQYQQLYEANSKVIQTAASLFQTLLGIFS